MKTSSQIVGNSVTNKSLFPVHYCIVVYMTVVSGCSHDSIHRPVFLQSLQQSIPESLFLLVHQLGVACPVVGILRAVPLLQGGYLKLGLLHLLPEKMYRYSVIQSS